MRKAPYIILILFSVMIINFLIHIVIMACTGHEFNIIHGYNIKNEEVIKKESKNANEINELDIMATSDNINIIQSENDEINVIQYSNDSNPKEFSSNFNNSKWEINEQNMICAFCFFRKNRLEISIPKTYNKNLTIKTASGNININSNLMLDNSNFSSISGNIKLDDINSNKLNIKSTSGRIETKEIQTNELTTNTTSGDINIDTINGEKSTIESNSGKVEIKNNNSKTYIKTISGDINCENSNNDNAIKSTSGRININSLKGKADLKTTSGDININLFLPTNNSTFKSTSGKIEVNMDKESSCSFDLDSVSGKIKYPGKMNDNKFIIQANTTSGNILFNE